MLQIYAESLYWNHGLSQSRAARRVSRAGRVCSFEKPARSAQIEAWSRIQDRGSEFRTRDSGYGTVFDSNFQSSVEIRIRTQNHKEFQYELIRSPDYTLIFCGVGS